VGSRAGDGGAGGGGGGRVGMVLLRLLQALMKGISWMIGRDRGARARFRLHKYVEMVWSSAVLLVDEFEEVCCVCV